MDEKLLEILEKYDIGIVAIIFVILIILLISNIEQVMIIKSACYGLFSKFSVWAKKKHISNKVRGNILKSVKEQSIDNTEILPNDLKVVWINNEDSKTFIQNNQIIIRVKQSSNPHENFITAVSEYVSTGLLYNVRRYLNSEVINASKILMTKKIIQNSDKASLTYLEENYIIPKLENDLELKELYSDLLKIDGNGMFTGIMLNEFSKAGMTIYGEIVDPELLAESKEFMRFLYNIAAKISTDTKDLCFNREYFKVAIFLTASNKTLKRNGITPFIKAISKTLENGIETIYIFALGSKREIAKQISDEIDSDFRISTIKKHTYKHISANGKRTPGVFYECDIYKQDND